MSSNIRNIRDARQLIAKARGLKSGDDGGSYDDMEQRVKRLEVDVAEMKTDLKTIRDNVSEMKGRVSMLPGYPGIATIIAIIGGALLGISRLFPAGPP